MSVESAIPDRPKCQNHQCSEPATIFIQMRENIGLCKKCYWAINLGLTLFKQSICPTCQKQEEGIEL